MKIIVIHGQSHKGSTYNIAKQLCDKLGGEVTEFFLPKDFDCCCKGCTACFIKKTSCPDYEKLKPLTAALDNVDVIILASPVYVMHATDAMKSFLDHYRYMVHRPVSSNSYKDWICLIFLSNFIISIIDIFSYMLYNKRQKIIVMKLTMSKLKNDS